MCGSKPKVKVEEVEAAPAAAPVAAPVETQTTNIETEGKRRLLINPSGGGGSGTGVNV